VHDAAAMATYLAAFSSGAFLGACVALFLVRR